MTNLNSKELLEGVTPGPWVIIPAIEYDGDDEELAGAIVSLAGIEGADGSPVCVFGSAEGSGTLFENECDYRLIASAPRLARRVIELEDAAMKALNYIESTEGEFGITLDSGDALRAALLNQGEGG